jgi:hypothetical protein
MECISRRRRDSIAQIDGSHKSSCEHRGLHLEAIEPCAGNFELAEATTFWVAGPFVNNHDPYFMYVTSCMTSLLFCPWSVGADKLEAIQRWTMLSTRSFSIETSARELIGRWTGRVGCGVHYLVPQVQDRHEAWIIVRMQTRCSVHFDKPH